MSTSTPEPGVLLFEAPTAEEALEAVTAEVGPGAQILSAERSRTGGIGGFFAREIVQLRVRRPELAATPATPAPPASASSAQPQGLDALMAGLLADEEDDERSFAEVLRARLGVEEQVPAAATLLAQPAVGSGPAPGPAQPAPEPPAQRAPAQPAPARPTPAQPDPYGPEPSGTGVEWSLTNLKRLGLPSGILETLHGLDPRDDAAWVAALAHAISPLTRPLPGGAAAYVGPRAAKLGRTMDVPVVAVGAEADPERHFAVEMQGGEAARSWLAWTRARRWLHVVIGGEGWRPLLFDEPLAVSWVGEENLCEAIRLSSELGLVLGFGLGAGRGARARRAVPLEVALTIRDLLPRR